MIDLTKKTTEELLESRAYYLERYKELKHFEGDDGDSDMYYFEHISPINEELKQRGVEL